MPPLFDFEIFGCSDMGLIIKAYKSGFGLWVFAGDHKEVTFIFIQYNSPI